MPDTSLTKRKLTPLEKRRKIALIEADLTVADVARSLGVSRQMISMLLSGKARSDRLEGEVAKVLRTTREQLFPSSAHAA